jgi:sec-independent protein translocase protein TatB
MFNVGGGEVLVILLIALIVLGPDKLPNAARQAGKYLGDFRRMSNGFQRELRDAMDLNDLTGGLTGTPKPKPTSPGGPTERPAPVAEPAPAAADTDGAAPSSATASTNGSAPTNGSASSNGTPPTAGDIPAVRKRSIEVDGPSTSFD